MDYWPTVDRCAWDLPVFHTLLERGVEWVKQPVLSRLSAPAAG
jgi:hypothetical protein